MQLYGLFFPFESKMLWAWICRIQVWCSSCWWYSQKPYPSMQCIFMSSISNPVRVVHDNAATAPTMKNVSLTHLTKRRCGPEIATYYTNVQDQVIEQCKFSRRSSLHMRHYRHALDPVRRCSKPIATRWCDGRTLHVVKYTAAFDGPVSRSVCARIR